MTVTLKKRLRMISTAFLMVLMTCFCLLADPASAEASETSEKKISYEYSGESGDGTGSVRIEYPVAGAKFTLFYVGKDISEEGYLLDEPFSGYDVTLFDKNAAETLADYVLRDLNSGDEKLTEALAPAAEFETGEDGIAEVFGLVQGIYLLTGEVSSDDTYQYIPQSVLLKMPTVEDDQACWNVTIKDKYDRFPLVQLPHDFRGKISVMKIWKNDDEQTRPEEITVQLLCNNQLLSDAIANASTDTEKEDLERALAKLTGDNGTNDIEVVLDAANNWSYQWEKLDKAYTWTVVEKTVPEGYTVSNTTEGSSIVITNTKNSSDTPNTPDTSDTPSTPDKTGTSSGRLPQTGQLWWPIPMLIAAGLLCILIGLLNLRKEKH